MMTHEFEGITYFCVKCGVAMEQAVDRELPCHEGLIAISHIVAKRRMSELVERVRR
jgi:hypothetical protein